MKITRLNNYSDKHITYPDELELNKTLTVLAGPNGCKFVRKKENKDETIFQRTARKNI